MIKVYHVKLSIAENNVGVNRQMPGRGFCWGDYCFHINEDVEEVDFWVYYSKGRWMTESTLCSPKNTIFITGEPETTYHYSQGFINQFSKVISVQPKIKHPDMILSQPSLPWYVGRQIVKDNVGGGKHLIYNRL